MFDPIEYAIRSVFGFFVGLPPHIRPIIVIIAVMGVFLVVSLFKKNLMGSEERRAEKRWSDLSGLLNTRIYYLLPTYQDAVLMHAKNVATSLQKSKGMVQLFKSIPTKIKERGEFDYCMQDAEKEENILTLQEEFEALCTKHI